MANWDPIGVSDTPEAADEYDFYIGGIYRLLEQGATETDMYTFLRDIEVNRMELVNEKGEPLMSEGHRRAAVSSLMELRHYFVGPS
ncbi:MAG: hypothetical protein ACLPWF_13755 [Bryobacteraceae bacterium]